MNSLKILLVEDDMRLRKLVATYLRKEDFEVVEAEDGKIAMERWSESEIDLVILDVMLPEYDGWTVCRNIRRESRVPIMMLTARSEENDKLFGFELGVDDYVTKPFSTKELVARVKALLKRSGKTSFEDEIVFGTLKINTKYHMVFINEEVIELTPKEYDLLVYFINNKNIALSREKILDGVWGHDYFGDLRTVDTHVKRLRKKLQEMSEYLSTVRGLGYRFEVKL